MEQVVPILIALGVAILIVAPYMIIYRRNSRKGFNRSSTPTEHKIGKNTYKF